MMKKKEETNTPLNILGGTKQPTNENGYLARDGLYYNGYMLPDDAAEDYFGDAFREIADEIARSDVEDFFEDKE